MAKKKQSPQQQLTPRKYIKEKARNLPIAACFVGKNWKTIGETIVIVARRHVQGTYTIGAYLVDLLCKGVVDSTYHFNIHEDDYKHLLEKSGTGDELTNMEYSEAHNLIYGAIAFAEEAGIHPDSSFELTRYLLEEDTDDIPLIEYEFGRNGMHFLMAKSRLDADKYLPSLRKNLDGNFIYSIMGRLIHDDDEFDDEPMPRTPYRYEYPEYPAVLALENQFLAPLFYDPAYVNNFPEEIITKVLSCPRESLIRDLEQMTLHEIDCTCIGIPKERSNSEFYSPLIHTVFFLGELGHPGSLDVVLELLRQDSDFCDYHFADTMGDLFVPTLYLLGKDQLPALFDFMKEPYLSTWSRCEIFPAVALVASQHPERRAEVIEWFRQLLVFYTDTVEALPFCDGDLTGLMMTDLMDIHAVELLPEIKALLDTGRVDVDFSGGYQELEDEILSGIHTPGNYSFDIYERYREYGKKWNV